MSTLVRPREDNKMHEDAMESSDYCADSWCDGERARDMARQPRRHCTEHGSQRLVVLRATRRVLERSNLGKPRSRQAAYRRLSALRSALPPDAGITYHSLADACGGLDALIRDLDDEHQEPRTLADIWDDALLVVETIAEWTADIFATPGEN